MADKFLLYVPKEAHGLRLDRFLTTYLPPLPPSPPLPPLPILNQLATPSVTAPYSRTTIQKMIEAGLVTINGVKAEKFGQTIVAGSCIEIAPQEPLIRSVTKDTFPNFFNQTRIFEHEHFLIINKPSGILTHPTHQNNPQIAISDLFIHDYPSVAQVGEKERPGIVHRLDKYTSGLLILAKTNYGYEKLKELFAQRTIQKTYSALVEGHPPIKSLIVNAIMRDPIDPCRMTCCAASVGKPARTNFEIVAYYKDYSLVKAFPLTGRTHQIRVHFSYNGYPLAGDTLYGAKKPCALGRYMLHASEISFDFDGIPYHFSAPLPDDFKEYIAQLQGPS